MAGSVFVYTSLVKFTFVCPVWRLTETPNSPAKSAGVANEERRV